jgi:hypothetical protein
MGARFRQKPGGTVSEQPLKSGMDTTKFFSAVGTAALYIGLLFDLGYFLGFDLNFFMLLIYKDHLAVLAFFAGCSSLS